MRFIFHPEAEDEFLQSIEYFENSSPGLGEDFAGEVYHTIRNIVSHPHAWPAIESDIRRCLTHRFPYGVIYSIENKHIIILSVMHLHRHPDYWKNRR